LKNKIFSNISKDTYYSVSDSLLLGKKIQKRTKKKIITIAYNMKGA
jgi:hypothetical protein